MYALFILYRCNKVTRLCHRTTEKREYNVISIYKQLSIINMLPHINTKADIVTCQ